MTIFYTVLKSRFSDRDLKIIYETFSDDFISRVQKSKVNIYIDKRFTLMLLIIGYFGLTMPLFSVKPCHFYS